MGLTGAAESTVSLDLLALTTHHERSGIGIWIPRALRPVGEHHMMDSAAVCCPFGQRPTSTELDIIWVGSNRERDAWRAEVATNRCCQRRWLPRGVGIVTAVGHEWLLSSDENAAG